MRKRINTAYEVAVA